MERRIGNGTSLKIPTTSIVIDASPWAIESNSKINMNSIFLHSLRMHLLRKDRSRHRYLFRQLVTQMSPTTSLLRADSYDNEVYLIGTAHISEASAKEVVDLISTVRPETVFIELDSARAAQLRTSANKDPFELALRNLLGNFSGASLLGAVFSGFYKVLKGYGFVPGVEMKAAIEEADRVGATVYYGDRDVQDTLRDLSSVPPSMLLNAMRVPPPPELEDKFARNVSNLADSVEQLKTREHARLMTNWMDEALPDVSEIMIHRRDRIMARNLREHCSRGKVVAVVGLAHCDGIEREWQAFS